MKTLFLLLVIVFLPSCETLPISASYETPEFIFRYNPQIGFAGHVVKQPTSVK